MRTVGRFHVPLYMPLIGALIGCQSSPVSWYVPAEMEHEMRLGVHSFGPDATTLAVDGALALSEAAETHLEEVLLGVRLDGDAPEADSDGFVLWSFADAWDGGEIPAAATKVGSTSLVAGEAIAIELASEVPAANAPFHFGIVYAGDIAVDAAVAVFASSSTALTDGTDPDSVTIEVSVEPG